MRGAENEKEEYRIRYNQLQEKTDSLEKSNEKLSERVAGLQAELKEAELELKTKQQKFESLNHRESLIRIQNELEDCQKEMVSLKSQRGTIAQKLQNCDSEKAELKSDNIKMCQIIREYESRISQLENSSKNSALTLEAKIKSLSSENNSLNKDIKKLYSQLEESNNDCERITKEYKQLLNQITDNKSDQQKRQKMQKAHKLMKEEYEIELKRISSILDQSEDTKKQLIEKYAQELDSLKDSYERTITIQKENLKIYTQKAEEEMNKLQRRKDTKNKGQKDRLSELVRECSLKEANLKTTRGDNKTLKVQISKLKNSNKELRKKILELNGIIDVNPRAKRMLERQKGDLEMNYNRFAMRIDQRSSFEGNLFS